MSSDRWCPPDNQNFCEQIDEEIGRLDEKRYKYTKTRDSRGRFIRGHQPLNPRNKTTGRFIGKSSETATIERIVDKILSERLKDGN